MSTPVPSPSTLKCPYLSFQPFLSLLTDQWRQRRQRQLWFEGQVRTSGVQEAEERCLGQRSLEGRGGSYCHPFSEGLIYLFLCSPSINRAPGEPARKEAPVLQSLQAGGGIRCDRGRHSEGQACSAGGSLVPEVLIAGASPEGFQEDTPLNFQLEGKVEEKCPTQRPVSLGGVQEQGVRRLSRRNQVLGDTEH